MCEGVATYCIAGNLESIKFDEMAKNIEFS